MPAYRPYEPYEGLQTQIDGEGVLVATLDRPERLNAFNGPLRKSIRALIDDVASDDAVRVLVLTGNGRGFCSGADLTAEDRSPVPVALHDPAFAWCVDLLEVPKPTIAAVNGVAAGGGLGFALLCDIRICSTEARLLPIWMKRAIHPDDLITWTLPRLVGMGRALHWLYLAEEIPLDDAVSSGLVHSVVEPDELLPTTMDLAGRLAAMPPMHLALTKQAMLKGMTRDPWDAAAIESWGQGKAMSSEDFAEGVAAFRDRRQPRFTGR
ncbi:MAG: enoyl-CoA hydratase/isomerase family protein [Acidimicrobiia bacterium]|nr:enoyl-CoA hydratase/isomerase family protein [Acidimicrobiia bacterium]